METIERALVWASQELRAAGVDSPYLEAQLLLAHVLACDRLELVTNKARLVAAPEWKQYKQLVFRRQRRIPLAYILGKKSFLHWDLLVKPGVLIPRPETELLVETAVTELNRAWSGKKLLLADIGTGSGAIAVSLAALLPNAKVHGVDVSAQALAVARQNAILLGVEQRVAFHRGDLLQPLAAWRGKFHCITANLPYVSRQEYANLEPELYYEPREALVAGEDGLEYHKRLLTDVGDFLAPGGLLLLEIGWLQAGEVLALCAANNLTGAEAIRDLAGCNRIIRVSAREK